MTIEGGQGWQLDETPADALVDVDPDAVAIRRAVLVLVALLLAAAAGALLADLRGAGSAGGTAPAEVRLDLDGLRARPVPAAPVDRADGVRVHVRGWEVDAGVATVALEAVNDSGAAVAVEVVQPSPGLVAGLRGPDGQDVTLPLVLPPGRHQLVAELSVTDCARLGTDGRAWTGGTLVELRLARDVGSAFFGSRYPLLASLEAASCPAGAR